MAYQQELDDLSAFEAKETSHRIPLGWAILFWALVAFGPVYLWLYTPSLGGWQQAQEAEGGGASSGASLLATIAFTAVATLVAIVLALAQRARKARSGA